MKLFIVIVVVLAIQYSFVTSAHPENDRFVFVAKSPKIVTLYDRETLIIDKHNGHIDIWTKDLFSPEGITERLSNISRKRGSIKKISDFSFTMSHFIIDSEKRLFKPLSLHYYNKSREILASFDYVKGGEITSWQPIIPGSLLEKVLSTVLKSK